jgi:hypothetical protein
VVGLVRADHPLGTAPGATPISLGIQNRNLRTLTMGGAVLSTDTASDAAISRVCVAVDLDAGLLWFTTLAMRNLGRIWNNSATSDPDTGVGGISIAALIGAPLFPSFYNASSGRDATINTGEEACAWSPTGFAAWTTGVVSDGRSQWDPGGRTATITLSSDGRTATVTTTSSSYDRGTKSKAITPGSGKPFYLEATISSAPGSTVRFGLTEGATSYNTTPGSGTTNNTVGWVPQASRRVMLQGAYSSPSGGAAETGAHTVGIAVDPAAMRLWWTSTGMRGLDGVNWNNDPTANPATDTGGLDISGLAPGNYFPAMSGNVVGLTFLLNTGQDAFQFQPAGFAAYDTPAESGPASYDLTGSGIATGLPALGTPPLGQDRVLAAAGLSAAPPGLGSPVLGQVHALASTEVVSGFPTLGSPAPGQGYSLAAVGATSGALALPAAVFGQGHTLAAEAAASGAPVLAALPLGQGHALAANAVTAGAVTLAAPALHIAGTPAADRLDTGLPVLGVPALAQQHALTAALVQAGAPTAGAPSLAGGYALAASPVLAGVPGLGTPALGQGHALAARPATARAPVVGIPAAQQGHFLAGEPILVRAPALGAPALNGSDAVTPTFARLRLHRPATAALALGRSAAADLALSRPLTARLGFVTLHSGVSPMRDRLGFSVWQGQSVRVAVNFQDAAGAPMTNPAGVTITAKRPDGTKSDLTEVSGEDGTFYADFIADMPGYWRVRAECTGPSAAVDECTVQVAASQVLA